jgi:hypothetical protein
MSEEKKTPSLSELRDAQMRVIATLQEQIHEGFFPPRDTQRPEFLSAFPALLTGLDSAIEKLFPLLDSVFQEDLKQISTERETVGKERRELEQLRSSKPSVGSIASLPRYQMPAIPLLKPNE